MKITFNIYIVYLQIKNYINFITKNYLLKYKRFYFHSTSQVRVWAIYINLFDLSVVCLFIYNFNSMQFNSDSNR